jgi:hypothetical protein
LAVNGDFTSPTIITYSLRLPLVGHFRGNGRWYLGLVLWRSDLNGYGPSQAHTQGLTLPRDGDIMDWPGGYDTNACILGLGDLGGTTTLYDIEDTPGYSDFTGLHPELEKNVMAEFCPLLNLTDVLMLC